jgi:hypothetical protein
MKTKIKIKSRKKVENKENLKVTEKKEELFRKLSKRHSAAMRKLS